MFFGGYQPDFFTTGICVPGAPRRMVRAGAFPFCLTLAQWAGIVIYGCDFK
jgi:hypothetical protein